MLTVIMYFVSTLSQGSLLGHPRVLYWATPGFFWATPGFFTGPFGGHTNSIKGVIMETVTKSDLKELKDDLKSEFKKDINHLEKLMNAHFFYLKWLFGSVVIITIISVGKIAFFS